MKEGNLKAAPALSQRVIAAVMAVVLCLGLAPHAAWAQGFDANASSDQAVQSVEAGRVTLAISYDKDGDGTCELVLNSSYAYDAGATLGDLLAAAKTAGDIADYSFSNSGWGSYIDTITLADGTRLAPTADFSKYWASYKNGTYASGVTDCTEGDFLDGVTAFQFEYSGYPEAPVAYDWSKAPVATNIDGVIAGRSGLSTNAQTLLTNLNKRFVAGGKDAAITNATFAAALGARAYDTEAVLDGDAIVAALSAAEAEKPLAAGTLAKYITALTAAGVDCTRVADASGSRQDLIEQMVARTDVDTLDVYSAVVMLPVYSMGYEGIALNVVTPDQLIDVILANQAESGLFGYTGWEDSQTTAQAILALLPYKVDNEKVAAAIDKAEAKLLSMQNADGGFAYMPSEDGSASESNLDATADIVTTLCALGYNCTGGKQLTTASGATPVSYLLSKADSDLTGFVGVSAYSEEMTAATVLCALVASANSVTGACDVHGTVRATATSFSDVQDDWYTEAVSLVAKKGLMRGYSSSDAFGIGDKTDRAMMTTILWRLADTASSVAYVPAMSESDNGFKDVESGLYYTGAANWAWDNEVIHGYDVDGARYFQADRAMSFEEMVTMLANYIEGDEAVSKTDTKVLDQFDDASSVSDYARASMAWAVNNGLVNGEDNHDGTRSLKADTAVNRERVAGVLFNAHEEGYLPF